MGVLFGNKAFLVYLTHSTMPALCLLPDVLWRDQFLELLDILANRKTLSFGIVNMCSSLKCWVTLQKQKTAFSRDLSTSLK